MEESADVGDPGTVRGILDSTRTSLFDDTKYVVLGGGALYGVMYIGVLQELCGHDPDSYTRWLGGLAGVAGTSAGALIGLLVAAGKTPWEMRDLIVTCGLARVMKGMLDLQPSDMVTTAALTTGAEVDAVCQEVVARVTGSSATTLAQFFLQTGRRFVAVVTNVDTQSPEFWDHESEPELPLWVAVRATTSLPLIFPMVVLPDGRKVYDGGITCNVPCTLFPPAQTLVCLIQNYSSPEGPKPSLVANIVGTLMEAAQTAPMRQRPALYMRSVPCPFPAHPPVLGRLAFHASADVIDALISDGVFAVLGVYARDVCVVLAVVRVAMAALSNDHSVQTSMV